MNTLTIRVALWTVFAALTLIGTLSLTSEWIKAHEPMNCHEHNDKVTSKMSDDLLEALFQMRHSMLTHAYNDYGCILKDVSSRTDATNGYAGGHSGMDVQTKSVYKTDTADEAFYSLTRGVILYVDRDPESSNNFTHGHGNAQQFGAISVYVSVQDGGPEPNGMTVRYLHARHIFVKQHQRVSVGTRLGIQGGFRFSKRTPEDRKAALDSTDGEHVHIEVQLGRVEGRASSYGAGSVEPGRRSIEPMVPIHAAWVIGKGIQAEPRNIPVLSGDAVPPHGGYVSGLASYVAGSTARFEAVAMRGYKFVSWAFWHKGEAKYYDERIHNARRLQVSGIRSRWYVVAYFEKE